MSRELERLARRIAGGDVAAARRALALLEGEDVAGSCARSLKAWWDAAVDSAARRLIREIREAHDESQGEDFGAERAAHLIDSMLPWTPESPGSIGSNATASYLMLAGAGWTPPGAASPSPFRDAAAAFRLDVVSRIIETGGSLQ